MRYKVIDKKVLSNKMSNPLLEKEIPVELDDSSLVAVSTQIKWLENGAGVSIIARARLVDNKGLPIKVGNSDIETALPATFDLGSLELYNINELSTELSRIVLGEEPSLLKTLDDGSKRPFIDLSDEVLRSVNIRNAAKVAKEIKSHKLEL